MTSKVLKREVKMWGGGAIGKEMEELDFLIKEMVGIMKKVHKLEKVIHHHWK